MNDLKSSYPHGIVLLPAVFVLILTGCTSTRVLDTPQSYTEVTEKGTTLKATIWTSEQVLHRGTSFSATPDSSIWFDVRTSDYIHVPTDNLSTIEFKSHGRGALEGLFISGLLAAGGALVGAAAGGDFFTTGEAAAIGASMGGLTAILSIPIGAAVGKKTVYQVPDQ